eukprot:TRINITY_DN4217_c0_g1_i5.p1 TRINITY_DN4217_c0_g1~~TRINITY_DN4217_c0_g1_i5.p1  ORF type:complete len:199 (-),score=72.29 TRINITY_DN4217_c0_g1_i5:263-859(-)
MRLFFFFFFQAEDGIRDAQESRGLGDVYKRQQLDAALGDVEHQLGPLLNKPLKELASELPALEAAKLHVVGAFAINTLFYVFLKTQGVDPTTHPVKQEMDRVKAYFKKIRQVAGNAATETQNAQLNVGAANRFIAAALGPEGDTLRDPAKEEAEDSAEPTEQAPAEKKKAGKSSSKRKAPESATPSSGKKKKKKKATK